MQVDDIDNLLPQDDELVRRENIFLKLFDKFSIDEDEDAELADLELSDKMDEADDNAAGSSFSETSSIEGEEDDANGKSTVIDDIAGKLEPAIQKRVNAWPSKGINLQLKRVDPSVSVEEWLKANQESTTTTKKYKKTVVNEDNKTTTTTTKHFTTTTKRATFRTVHFPRLMAINDEHPKQIPPRIDECPNDDITDVRTKSKDTHISKPKDRPETSTDPVTSKKLPVTIALSKLPNVDTSKLTKPKRSDKQKPFDHMAAPTGPSVIKKSKQPTKRQYPQPDNNDEPKTTSIESKSKKKIASSAVQPPVDENKRCLRSRFKENIAPPVRDDKNVDKPTKTLKRSSARDDKTVDKPPKNLKPTVQKKSKPSKAKSKEPVHQMDLTSTDAEPSAIVPCETKTASVNRSRLPLKDKPTNRIETVHNLSKVRVNLKKLPCFTVATRRSVRLQNAATEQQTSTPNDDTTANRQLPSLDVQTMDISKFPTQPSADVKHRGRPKKGLKENNRRSANHHVTAIENGDATAQISTVSRRPISSPKTLMKNLPEPIVIHSPNWDTLLGTKVNDTMMLVTKHDYNKHINAKYARKTSGFERSYIPMNRRVIFQPPMLDVTADTDYDSECEDVLLTSFMHTGHFAQIKV